MSGVRSAVFGASLASAVITVATHCQCMWRRRGAGHGGSRRSSTFLCEAGERHRNRECIFFPNP